MYFKGFEDWVEIFRGGRQVDSTGREHDGDSLIDKAVALFDPGHHEPPLVVGHPMDNAPAFGWVAGLRKQGGALFAKFRQVVPEFARAVESGLYKKRSASFYPDGRLRHVGFLGAAPPAVKGLADMKFSGGEGIDFEFEEGRKDMDVKELMEFLKFWKGAGEAKEPAPMFSEAQVRAMIDEALVGKAGDPDPEPAGKSEEEIRAEVAAEFAEKARKARIAARKSEIGDWIGKGIEAGKILPAWVDKGLTAFAEALPDVVNFGEGKQADGWPWFRDFLDGLPAVVELGEIVKRDAGAAGNAAQKIDALVTKKMRDFKDMNYGAAFASVQSENPELAAEYAAEMEVA